MHVSTLLMDKAPTGGMSYDVTTGGHIRQVSVFAKFMKLDRNPPQGGVFLEWVMGTYQIGMHHLLAFHAPIWFGVSGRSDHSIYHNEWCHYGYLLLYRWPITLAPSVYPGAMVHFLVGLHNSCN